MGITDHALVIVSLTSSVISIVFQLLTMLGRKSEHGS